MEQCRVFLRNLRWGVNETQLRAMLQPAGFKVLEVKMVRKSYFGEHSLCSAFVTLDSHEAVGRLVGMLNGCNDYSLTPTAVFAERAVPRMAALRAVQAAPKVQAKVQAAPTVQAAPKEEEEEHPGDVYPNLEPELLAEKTEGTAEAAAKEPEEEEEKTEIASSGGEDQTEGTAEAAAKEPEEEEEKTEIASSGGEDPDTSPAHSRCSRRRKSRSSRRSRRKSRSSRRKSRSSRRKSRSQKSRSSRRKSRSSQRSRSSRRKSRSSDGKSSST